MFPMLGDRACLQSCWVARRTLRAPRVDLDGVAVELADDGVRLRSFAGRRLRVWSPSPLEPADLGLGGMHFTPGAIRPTRSNRSRSRAARPKLLLTAQTCDSTSWGLRYCSGPATKYR